MATPQIILITGSTRGIGLAISQTLGLAYPSNTYLLGCRSLSSGQAAIQTLREKDVKAELIPIILDVSDDSSIAAAAEDVRERWWRVDVLVNNAGIGLPNESHTPAGMREQWARIFDVNITSVFAVTTAFLPLLHASKSPKVINISSGRASLTLSAKGTLPPIANTPHSLSKVGLNALTIEMQKSEDSLGGETKGRIKYFAANPGHCATALNGFKGTKDPVVGAEVVRLVVGGGWEGGRFVEVGEEGKGLREVPW